MNLICGINPVLEALASGTRHFDRLLVVKGLRSRRLSDAIRRATRLGIPLRFEMRDTLDRLAGGVPHQGLIAIVSAKPLLSLEELLGASRSPALLVALDGVEDPRNLGAILRTVEAAGADGALLPERHSAGLSETVDRTSAGALEHVQVAQVGNLVHALEALKERGVWIVGLDAGGQERWDGVDLTQPVCLVLGGEGKGIRRLVREHCDHLVSIPQFGHVSSLNVSVAAGIALYEAVRQRGTVPSPLRPIPSRPPVEPRVIGPHPDDEESDPGAAPPIPEDALSEGEDPEEEASPLPHVDIHGEEVAWGQGPTVLKPVGFERGRRARPGRHKGVRRRTTSKATPDAAQKAGAKAARKAAQEAPGTPGEQQPAAGGEAKPSRKGRRRRRRKKAAGPREKTASTGAKPPSGGSAPPVPEARAKGEGATRRRRRPRRRRSHGSG